MAAGRRRIRSVVALMIVLGLSAPVPAASQTSDPPYPSPEWFAREAENYAVNGQEPTRQITDPAFMVRWQEQSSANRDEYLRRQYLENTWWWDSRGNLCAHGPRAKDGDEWMRLCQAMIDTGQAAGARVLEREPDTLTAEEATEVEGGRGEVARGEWTRWRDIKRKDV